MIVLKVRNVHEALPRALELLDSKQAVREASSNGPVVRMPCPVATVYARPQERVEFHSWRDGNPFFHFYESLWMLAGRQDVAPLTRYVSRMRDFSDDGVTFNAAYGYRWRHAHNDVHTNHSMGSDQLVHLCNELRNNPSSRQCVLQIWDHRLDLGTQTKDHACNVAATFQISDGKLDMALFCRSNDVIWGALGANAVHFSMLMEYVARRVGVVVGTLTQISVNWHAYESVYEPMRTKMIRMPNIVPQPYEGESPMQPYPIAAEGADFDRWDTDCAAFVTADGTLPPYAFLDREGLDPFFRNVAWPVVKAHDLYKTMADHCHNRDERDRHWKWIFDTLDRIEASDWQLACHNWMMRRKLKDVP